MHGSLTRTRGSLTSAKSTRGKLRALVAASTRELAERLADKDVLVAASTRELAERLTEKNERFDDALKTHAAELAAAKHVADVATSRLSVRAILETSITEAFTWWPEPHDDARTPSDRLLKMLDPQKGYESLKAYVRVAATDNGVPPDDALKEARKLYTSLCSRAHADAPEGSEGISSVVFDSVGRTALVAYAAIVHYTGRRISLYADYNGSPRAALPLKMRTRHDDKATEDSIRLSPLMFEHSPPQ